MPMANGRPFNATQPLGKMMLEDRISVNDLAARTRISYRRISDYLANRTAFSPHHLITFCEFFDCEPEDLISPEPPMKTNAKAGAYG